MKLVRFEMSYPNRGVRFEHKLDGIYIVVNGYTFPYFGEVNSLTTVFQDRDVYLILSRNIYREIARLDVYASIDSKVKFTVIVDKSDSRYWNGELLDALPMGWESDPQTIAQAMYDAHPLLRV